MAIDPSIALGYKGFEAPNPLTQYAQVAQIQNAQNQNALNQYQLATAKRADELTNVSNELYSKYYNPATNTVDQNALYKDLATRGFGSQIPVMQAKLADTEHKAATAAKAKIDAVAEERKFVEGAQRNLATNPSDANITAWLEDSRLSPVLSAQTKAQLEKEAASLLAMKPAQRVDYLSQRGATASDFTTRRGQNMVDARARDRLNAESATGTLTPASLDVAANVYLQTGVMPITGIGKGAANLKTQVMNRATELSTGKPAAEVAGGLVNAKQDVAARGKAVKDFSSGKQGDAVRSFNTAIDHLDTMSKLATALENRDTRLFNTVGNAFAAATGSAAPTDFDTAKAIVGGEVAKALTGANMALKDREEIRDSISRANSPAQLAGSVRRLQELMGGQLNSLNLQYETSTGRKDFDNKLTPRSKEVLKELRGEEPKTASTLQGQDKQALDWANANPTDPRAAAIKQRLGVR